MTCSEFWRRLSNVEFQREVNRLFWIEEFQAGETRDLGWSCREHAWVVALIAKGASLPAFIFNGSLTHVFPTPSGKGFVSDVREHSWVGLEGHGFFDISVKPSVGDPRTGKDYVLPRIALTKPIPRSWGEVGIAQDAIDGRQRLAAALNSKQPTAIYSGETVDTLLSTMVENAGRYINSPLTDRLKGGFGDDIYAKAFLYLNELFFAPRNCLGRCINSRTLASD